MGLATLVRLRVSSTEVTLLPVGFNSPGVLTWVALVCTELNGVCCLSQA